MGLPGGRLQDPGRIITGYVGVVQSRKATCFHGLKGDPFAYGSGLGVHLPEPLLPAGAYFW